LSVPSENITDIAKAIQLALGPVFLMTGIAGMLNVMSGRLSRIIDRGRALTEGNAAFESHEHTSLEMELKMLERRRHFTSFAIMMCTVAALLVCMVIVALFLEVMFNVPLHWIVGALFTMATLALVVGLSFFLREVHMSANTNRIIFKRKSGD
jgi:hypothetical protein